MRTASWIIREKATKRAVWETFNPDVVACLNTARYEAVPALQHLQELNRTLREQREVPE